MRKIIVSEFISLDGVFQSPGNDGSSFKHAGWTMPYGNDEFMKFKTEELFSSGALLLGAVTYVMGSPKHGPPWRAQENSESE